MQSGINIEEVKKYNASLREYKEKSAKLRAEIEFNQKELDKQCRELSAALGITVTPENVNSILEERIAKINNTMSVGNEILNRIKAEEASGINAGSSASVGVGTVSQAQTIPTPTAPTVSMPTNAPQAPNAFDISGGLPPIFANNSSNIQI